ncbi:MAG: 5'/3'-nucleotidase SurE [Elusimicrobia bacterium]|nr:5'/3'-nucleotidase SurE [Elusimicrobiota bacterium]MBP9127894.1 5'/3'-nucleotidase SurE [Elusimicrobiota bacterium]
MKRSRKNILVVNDDGVYGAGLKPLARALGQLGRVVVVVPERERSAASHAITLHKPIRVRKLEPNFYIMNGTPADCTRFGVIAMMKEKCDLVVSGINHGANLGADTMYSGTVGAAKEACMLGIPALAVSVTTKEEKPHFDTAARMAVVVAREMLNRGLPQHTLLNVNVPNHPWRSLKAVLVTTLGRRIYGRALSPRTDPRGQTYYWMAGAVPRGVAEPGSDIAAIEAGKVSVTPLKLYLTDDAFLPDLRRWRWSIRK